MEFFAQVEVFVFNSIFWKKSVPPDVDKTLYNLFHDKSSPLLLLPIEQQLTCRGSSTHLLQDFI